MEIGEAWPPAFSRDGSASEAPTPNRRAGEHVRMMSLVSLLDSCLDHPNPRAPCARFRARVCLCSSIAPMIAPTSTSTRTRGLVATVPCHTPHIGSAQNDGYTSAHNDGYVRPPALFQPMPQKLCQFRWTGRVQNLFPAQPELLPPTSMNASAALRDLIHDVLDDVDDKGVISCLAC